MGSYWYVTQFFHLIRKQNSGDTGVIMTMGTNDSVVGGTHPQRMPSCLRALDSFITWDEPIVSTFVRADVNKRQSGSGKVSIELTLKSQFFVF